MSDYQKPPALDGELVKEFVGNSHGDLARVQELLAQEPALLNASWDWGGGDWENGLEAAAHMGRRDIALYLLEQGARMNIYVAAMLGELDIVKAIATVEPAVFTKLGVHGIPLLQHAVAGGDHAKAVVEYLQAQQV
jgi:hypothetical protein